MRRNRFELVLVAASAVVFLALLVAGRLIPVWTADTSGYLIFSNLSDALARPRFPLYGWLLYGITLGTLDPWPVPVVQTLAYFGAIVFLFRSLQRAGVTGAAALALTLPLLIGNVVLRWNAAIHPEVVAVALILVALGFGFRVLAGGTGFGSYVAFGASLGCAYLLRPIWLPAVVFLPAGFGLLAAYERRTRTFRAVGGLAVAGVVPFLAVSLLRLALVNDFNVVSFGGFQMSGLATQMLTPELVERLPPDVQPLARAIQARRDVEIARGRVLPVPFNSRQQRSFVSVALQYFDYFSRNYNYLLYHVNLAMKRPGESQVAFNRRMQRYSLAVVRAMPGQYAAWVVGATVRSAGRMTVTNVPFVLALLVLIVTLPVAFFRRRGRVAERSGGDTAAVANSDGPASARRDRDLLVVVVLVVVYTASAGVLMVLASSPESRYLDSAGLMLPALPALALARLVCRDG